MDQGTYHCISVLYDTFWRIYAYLAGALLIELGGLNIYTDTESHMTQNIV